MAPQPAMDVSLAHRIAPRVQPGHARVARFALFSPVFVPRVPAILPGLFTGSVVSGGRWSLQLAVPRQFVGRRRREGL